MDHVHIETSFSPLKISFSKLVTRPFITSYSTSNFLTNQNPSFNILTYQKAVFILLFSESIKGSKPEGGGGETINN